MVTQLDGNYFQPNFDKFTAKTQTLQKNSEIHPIEQKYQKELNTPVLFHKQYQKTQN